MSEELNEALGIESPTRTSRDRTDLREPLRAWLAGVLPSGAEPSVSEVKSPCLPPIFPPKIPCV